MLAALGLGAWLWLRGGAARWLRPGHAAAVGRAWFVSDFEDRNLLAHWRPDGPRNRTNAVRIVSSPVRAGRYAALITLYPGDRGAQKERVELTLADEMIEREHSIPGEEAWYAWSMLVPTDFEDLPPGAFHIVGQWHPRYEPVRVRRLRRAAAAAASPQARPPRRQIESIQRGHARTGAPPVVLHLETRQGRRVLSLIARNDERAIGRIVGEVEVPPDRWLDLLFHIRWSMGADGLIEAWCDGRPLTAGALHGPTVYRANGNYFRIGLYRSKGFPMRDRMFIDEFRIGPTRASVEAPRETQGDRHDEPARARRAS